MLSRPIAEKYEIRDKIFVFTGTLGSMTRDQATQVILDRGGSVENRVTRATDYLIFGDKPGGTKWNAAQRLKTKMKPEQWLLAAIMTTTPGFVARKSVPDYQPITRTFTEPDTSAEPKQRRVRVR
jgi:BRCT domain type II-containing protein